jgi:serine/threonine protein kinase
VTTEPSNQENPVDQQSTCPQCHLKLSHTALICPNDGTLLLDERTLGSSLVAKYVFLEEIGSGGMGVVYKARQSLLNRTVAIKTLHIERLSKERILRFQREAEAASRLSHPNLVSVHDFGLTEHGRPYMVMDYLEGILLSELLKTKGSLSLAQAEPILSQICSGLAYAHDHGVIHRDLKPSNVMVSSADSDSPSIKIFDFGIAKILDEKNNPTLTQSGDIMGSPNYMSPEQITGSPLDRRSDIYSLGCMMFELLTGVTPFVGRTSMEAALKQVNEDPVTLHDASLGQIFPPELEKAVSKTLAKDPEQRYQSVAQLQLDLSKAMKAPVPEFFTPLETPITPARKRQMNARALAVMLSMVAIGALSAYSFISTTKHLPVAKPHAADESISAVMNNHGNAKISGQDHVPDSKASNSGSMDAVNDPSEAIIKAVTDDRVYHDEYAMKPKYQDALFVGQTISLKAFRERAVLPPYVNELRCVEDDMNDEYLAMVKDKPLKLLSLRYTLVTNRGLACLHVPTLTMLKLEGQKVTDDGIANLSKLRNLKKMSLFNNSITDVGVSRLRIFKQLHYLMLGKNLEVTDQGLHYLVSLPLDTIWLDFDQITNNGLRQLADIKTLRVLNLSRTRVTDEGMKILATMPLVSLELDGLKITDAGLMQLAASKTLREVSLKDTLVTEAGKRKFAAIQPHCNMVVKHDQDYLY